MSLKQFECIDNEYPVMLMQTISHIGLHYCRFVRILDIDVIIHPLSVPLICQGWREAGANYSLDR